MIGRFTSSFPVRHGEAAGRSHPRSIGDRFASAFAEASAHRSLATTATARDSVSIERNA
jgi:hypothetical protein